MSIKDTLKNKLNVIKKIAPTLGLSKKAEYLKKLRDKLKKKKK